MVLWVFGYGSLVWNPGFNFDEKVIGFIKDYKRVFDLACIDHRGTPEHPARTCTLEYKEGAVCWGVAYCVKGGFEKEKEAMQYLERRECEYDKKASVDFYKEGDDLQPAVTGVTLFISTPDKLANRYYLGPAPLKEMARTIATANGPCGNNRDYLFSLEKAMFHIGVIDGKSNNNCDDASSIKNNDNKAAKREACNGHKDDYVIKLANEVRRVLEDKKALRTRLAMTKPKLPLIQLVPLQEAAVMDSR